MTRSTSSPAGGDHDDRHVRALAQPAADRVAVDVGQAQVEQDEVGRRRGERLRAGRGALDREALAAQALGERLGDRVLVLDEQDLHARILAETRGA